MIDFEALITMKSVNKDWKAILGTLKICRQDKINVMLRANDYEWLKGELEQQEIAHYTLAEMATDRDLVKEVVFNDCHLDKIVICSGTILNAMDTRFVNQFFHIDVSHLRKSP